MAVISAYRRMHLGIARHSAQDNSLPIAPDAAEHCVTLIS
jgi:hypothetical protein